MHGGGGGGAGGPRAPRHGERPAGAGGAARAGPGRTRRPGRRGALGRRRHEAAVFLFLFFPKGFFLLFVQKPPILCAPLQPRPPREARRPLPPVRGRAGPRSLLRGAHKAAGGSAASRRPRRGTAGPRRGRPAGGRGGFQRKGAGHSSPGSLGRGAVGRKGLRAPPAATPAAGWHSFFLKGKKPEKLQLCFGRQSLPPSTGRARRQLIAAPQHPAPGTGEPRGPPPLHLPGLPPSRSPCCPGSKSGGRGRDAGVEVRKRGGFLQGP